MTMDLTLGRLCFAAALCGSWLFAADTVAAATCTCDNTCAHAYDKGCSDNGPGDPGGQVGREKWMNCELGTDCADCGPSNRTRLAKGDTCGAVDRCAHMASGFTRGRLGMDDHQNTAGKDGRHWMLHPALGSRATWSRTRANYTSSTQTPYWFAYGKYGMARVCKDLYTDLADPTVDPCGKAYKTYSPDTLVESTAVLDCGRSPKRAPGFVILSICAKSCMEAAKAGRGDKCCFIPGAYSHMFPCCREYGCCADQRSPADVQTLAPTPPPTPGLDGWARSPDKFCAKSGAAYPSAKAAEEACAASSSCAAVYDRQCDTVGSFYMCKANTAVTSSQGSCMYTKPVGANDDGSGDDGTSDSGVPGSDAQGCITVTRGMTAPSAGYYTPTTDPNMDARKAAWFHMKFDNYPVKKGDAAVMTGKWCPGRTRRRLRQVSAGLSITVQVSVDIEHNSAAKSVFDNLLDCLRHSATPATCSSIGGAGGSA